MSKKELTKWENKVKLYIALHPLFNWASFCGPATENRCKAPCWNHPVESRTKNKIMYINDKTFKITMAYGYPHPNEHYWCVEWVRYV